MEINKNFEIASRRILKVTSGEKYFKNEFLKDEATGKAYGLFIRDGVNYLGLYDTSQGTVGMGQKPAKWLIHGHSTCMAAMLTAFRLTEVEIKES